MKQAPRFKTKTESVYYRVSYSPDSSFFDKKTLFEYDSSGEQISQKVFIIDSTVLFSHHYFIRKSDTLYDIKFRLDNFYGETFDMDTSIFVDDKMVYTKKTSAYRIETRDGKESLKQPLPSYRYYEYSNDTLIKIINEQDNKKSYEQFSYDNQGRIKQRLVTKDDEPEFKYLETYTYNPKRLKIAQSELSVRGDDTLGFYFRSYEYDSNDSLIVWENSRNGMMFLKETYVIDSLGKRRVKYSYSDTQGISKTPTGIINYYYDIKGRLAEKQWIRGNRDPFTSWHYFYNEHDLVQEIRRYSFTRYSEEKLALKTISQRYSYEYY